MKKTAIRIKNYLLDAHNTGAGMATLTVPYLFPLAPVVYLVVTPFTAALTFPFLIIEPTSYDDLE